VSTERISISNEETFAHDIGDVERLRRASPAGRAPGQYLRERVRSRAP
jgi:hypothetical protein